MEIMEAIKFVMMYGLEIVVVALVGVTLLAGLYQLVRERIHKAEVSAATESVQR